MNQSLTITLQSSAVAATASAWIRMEQVVDADDQVSLEDAADLVDSLYDIEACVDEQTGGDDAEEHEPVAEDDFELIAGDFLERSDTCQAQDGSWTCQLTVARSHQDRPYSLVLDNGAVAATKRVQERAGEVVSIDMAASVNLRKPALAGFVYQWEGPVYTHSGAISPPAVTLLGSTLNFGRELSGTLRVSYDTVYDLVDIQINALAGSTEPAPCRALAFYSGLVEELTLEPPQPEENEDANQRCPKDHLEPTPENVSCYEIVERVTRCRCSGHEISREQDEVEVECPEGITCPGAQSTCRHLMGTRTVVAGYGSCPDEEGGDGTVSDPDYYYQMCCQPPEIPLPWCSVMTQIYRGGRGVDPAIIALYPNGVFIAVQPPDGICGEVTQQWRVNPLNCCLGVGSLRFPPDENPTVIDDYSVYHLLVDGGKLPITWRIFAESTGAWFMLDGVRVQEMTVEESYVGLFTGDVCGSVTVSATDGCSTANLTLLAADGHWQYVAGGNAKQDVPPVAGVQADSVSCRYVEGASRNAILTGYNDKYKLVQYYATSVSEAPLSLFSGTKEEKDTQAKAAALEEAQSTLNPSVYPMDRVSRQGAAAAGLTPNTTDHELCGSMGCMIADCLGGWVEEPAGSGIWYRYRADFPARWQCFVVGNSTYVPWAPYWGCAWYEWVC